VQMQCVLLSHNAKLAFNSLSFAVFFNASSTDMRAKLIYDGSLTWYLPLFPASEA
jgi:hypothetical protein